MQSLSKQKKTFRGIFKFLDKSLEIFQRMINFDKPYLLFLVSCF